MPCFLLTEQHSIVNGGFDVATLVIYKTIVDKPTYSPSAALDEVKHAAPVEKWLTERTSEPEKSINWKCVRCLFEPSRKM